MFRRNFLAKYQKDIQFDFATFIVVVCCFVLCFSSPSAAQKTLDDYKQQLSQEQKEAVTKVFLLGNDIRDKAIDSALSSAFPKVTQALVGDDEQSADLWRRFFYGTATYLGEVNSKNPVIGFYNPIYDGWVTVFTHRQGDHFKVFDVFVSSGREIRSQSFNPKMLKPEWLQTYQTATELPLNGLLQNVKNAEQNFHTHWPFLGERAQLSKTRPKNTETAKKLVEARVSFFNLNILNAIEEKWIENSFLDFDKASQGQKLFLQKIVSFDGSKLDTESLSVFDPWLPIAFLQSQNGEGISLISAAGLPSDVWLLIMKKGKPIILSPLAITELE